MNISVSFSATEENCGSTKMPTVTSANGIATAFMNGMRLPPLKAALSDQLAMSGSVTASKIRPTAVMSPNIVSEARIGFWVMKLAKSPFVAPSVSAVPV